MCVIVNFLDYVLAFVFLSVFKHFIKASLEKEDKNDCSWEDLPNYSVAPLPLQEKPPTHCPGPDLALPTIWCTYPSSPNLQLTPPGEQTHGACQDLR